MAGGVVEMVKYPPNAHGWVGFCVGLTFQCHSSIFRELIRVKEHRGLAIQRVLNIEHILVLEAFIVEVEIPTEIKMEKLQDYQFLF